MITFDLNRMNATQLAKLYKLLIALYRHDDAEKVYQAGVINCGPLEFCQEVAIA